MTLADLSMLSHFSHVCPFATPWTVAYQAPLSMGLSRQEYWSGMSFPPPGDLSHPGIKPVFLHWQEGSLPLSHLGSPSSFQMNRNLVFYFPVCIHAHGLPLGAQTVKNPFAMQETWVGSLGWKDPLEEGIATHSSILARRIPMDRGSWGATVYGVTKSQTQLSDQAQHACTHTHAHTHTMLPSRHL